MRVVRRLCHLLPGDQRRFIEEAIQQCADEHGNPVVGHPSLTFRRGWTELTVDDPNSWWHEWAAVHIPPILVAEMVKRGMDPRKAQTELADLRAAYRGSPG